MRIFKKSIYSVLAITLSLALLAGCGSAPDPENTDEIAFSYSEGIDDDGFWAGVKALDCIDLFTYSGMEIPPEVHQVSAIDVQEEIDYLLEYYTTIEEVTDRAIVDGDLVNIDYIGSVDGVEFDGGSTDGEGTDVTAGSTDYIDDFLMQIIGHLPGETIDVEVTFPDDYHNSSLQSQEAVFVTTINYIVETAIPELTDEFVETMLSASYGWTSVAEMRDDIRKGLQEAALEDYILDYLFFEVTLHTIPDAVMEYQVKAMQAFYQDTAEEYEMDLDTFLTEFVGVAGMDELIESNQEENTNNVRYALASQAVAEDAGISVDNEDVAAFFAEYMGISDYSPYEEEYGLPYLKQLTLQRKVLELIMKNAALL